MPDAGEIREQQRQTWDRFAGGWAKWDALISPMMAPVGDEMIRSLSLRDDGEHLDIAAGTGEPGLSIAALMPRGRVVLTDLSTAMLAEARANADRKGLRNVEFRECGVDDLEFADASFDSVACRFGLMFFPDIPAAIAEMARVLRPGGRMALAVWAEPPGNAWATVPMAAIGAEVEMPAPTPDAPGLFRCAEPEMISAILRDAGLRDVVETDVVATLDVASAEEYWALVCEVTAPVVATLANLDADTRARIDAAVLDRVRSYEDSDGVHMPGHARCVAGTK
jgi:SAM-dependent methyltransferase